MKAFAKINIGLNILNKRDDGFHNLETIFVPIDVYDEVFITDEGNNISIETKNPKLPTDQNNICYKAAKLLEDYSKVKLTIIINIIKNTPIGAGLGGGSSDAAIVLKEISKLYKINLSKSELSELALKIGSDVPYFLTSGVAYAKGRGEILEYIDITIPYWIVIIYPSIWISTKWAYSNYSVKSNPTEKNFKEILINNINNPDILKNKLSNDFEEIVFRRYPGLISVKNILYEKGAVYASLSGSGSSLFGFFDTKLNAIRGYNAFLNRYKVFMTEPDFKIE